MENDELLIMPDLPMNLLNVSIDYGGDGCDLGQYFECVGLYPENLASNCITVFPSCNRGCMDTLSFNYNLTAQIDDGSCITYEKFLIDSLLSSNYNLINTIEEASTSLSSLQQALDTWNTSVDLSSGWNMFGYGCPTSIDLAEGLSNHTDIIVITKDNNGGAFMPEFGFNGIGDFTPGFGYQIKLTEAIEGFSLCDWYVNDIPEDNIVSLQEQNSSLQVFVDSINASGCTDSLACNFDIAHLYDDGSCHFPEHGYDCNGNISVQIGDEALGGIIFYIDESGEHGLVASINDLGAESWGCTGVDIEEAENSNIGSGLDNTNAIINNCSQPSAALLCSSYSYEDYSDYFLPSIDELELIASNIGFNFLETYYWSSTHTGYVSAFGCRLWNDNTINITSYNKDNFFRVRPIRSF